MVYTFGARLAALRSSSACMRRYAGSVKPSSFPNTFQSVLRSRDYARGLGAVQSLRYSTDQGTGNKSDSSQRNLYIAAGIVAAGGAAFALKKFFSFDDDKTSGSSSSSKRYTPLFDSKSPTKLKIELPDKVQYLIVGAGTSAFSAYRAIRAGDVNAQVLMLGEEPHKPYQRPPLSKEFWYSDDKEVLKRLHFKLWSGKERSIFYEKEGFYCQPSELPKKEHGGVAHAAGVKVVRLDVAERKAHLEDGRVIGYDKCLIATGGRPRNLPVIQNAGPQVNQRITLFRTVEDFKQLYDLSGSVKSIAIIGGGFLGSELACALSKRGLETGVKITQVFPETGNMGMVLPQYLSRWATNKVRKEGVEVITGATVSDCSFDSKNKQVILKLSNDKQVSVDHVIVAVGLEPNAELAEASGLERDPTLGGFLVNAELQARANVWVAGDAACFYDVKLGRRRVEHHDHAVVSGRLAGENMTGAGKPYWHQSMFWSDLGPEVGYEAIGLVDSRLETVSVFCVAEEGDTPKERDTKTEQKPASSATTTTIEKPSTVVKENDYGKGVIFYLRDGIIVGVIMWNVFNKMPIARQIIKEGKKYSDFSEVAKLFNLYGDPDVQPAKKEEKQDDKKKVEKKETKPAETKKK